MDELEQPNNENIYLYADRYRTLPRELRPMPVLLNEREICFLYDISRRLGPGNYVELGTYRGGSALCMAVGMKKNNVDAHLYCVDLFDQRHIPPRYIYGSLGWTPRMLHQEVTEDLEYYGVADYVTLVNGDTAKTASQFTHLPFNFLFIDGDHSYEGCKADFEAWSPLVKPGGMIAFHDNNLPGVAQVLKEISWTTTRYCCKSLTILIKPGEKDATG